MRILCFSKGGLPLTVTELAPKIQSQRFALIVPSMAIDLDQSFPQGEVRLESTSYTPVLEALAEAPRSIGELLQISETSHLSFPRLHQILLMLVKLKGVSPALPEAGEIERQRTTEQLNRVIIALADHRQDLEYLASPVTGSGIRLPHLGQLFLSAHIQDLEPIAYAYSRLEQQQLPVPEISEEGDEDPMQILASHHSIFQAEMYPLLRQLTIVGDERSHMQA